MIIIYYDGLHLLRSTYLQNLNSTTPFTKIYKNSSGDEIANVNFLRRYGTYVLQNTKKREPTSFTQLDDS